MFKSGTICTHDHLHLVFVSMSFPKRVLFANEAKAVKPPKMRRISRRKRARSPVRGDESPPYNPFDIASEAEALQEYLDDISRKVSLEERAAKIMYPDLNSEWDVTRWMVRTVHGG